MPNSWNHDRGENAHTRNMTKTTMDAIQATNAYTLVALNLAMEEAVAEEDKKIRLLPNVMTSHLAQLRLSKIDWRVCYRTVVEQLTNHQVALSRAEKDYSSTVDFSISVPSGSYCICVSSYLLQCFFDDAWATRLAQFGRAQDF